MVEDIEWWEITEWQFQKLDTVKWPQLRSPCALNIFCNLCNQINGKCVDMIVSAANFTKSNSNSKCPQISSYGNCIKLSKHFHAYPFISQMMPYKQLKLFICHMVIYSRLVVHHVPPEPFKDHLDTYGHQKGLRKRLE